ncbi:MAG: DUF4440 domain-containing protein [Lysobacterales bacterium]|jgi:uncharacterized protein (TIGR02246 family)
MLEYNLRLRGLAALGLVLMLGTAWAGEESDMMHRVTQWQNAYNAGDLEAVAAMYAEDGCRMPPNQETANGRAAILAQLQASQAVGPQVKLGLTRSDNNDGFAWGTGTYAIMGPDGAVVDQGKWMSVSSRSDDGSWLTQCDIWNSNQPLPAQ